MENLNIALIGCGMIGREHIERIQNRIRNARIVAVCDVFEEGAKKGAEIAGAGTKVYTDFNEAINDACIADAVLDTLDVLTADHAAADQCNVQVFHDEFLLKCCVKWVKRWFL